MQVHKEQRSNAMLALDNCKHESGFSVMEADELFFINGGSEGFNIGTLPTFTTPKTSNGVSITSKGLTITDNNLTVYVKPTMTSVSVGCSVSK